MGDNGQDKHSDRTTVVLRSQRQKASSTDRLDYLPFEKWDRYRVLHLLGEGGTAKVYKAVDLSLNRNVALKFLLGGDPSEQKRLLQEARAQAQIQHDHVCKIYEVGTFSGKHYIAMQFIDGESLEKAAEKMKLEEKCKMIQQVAEGIHAAHRLGIIHRDLKPANIMVEPTETGWRPYVLDFGLAREMSVPGTTTTGLIMGTPSYMSPEQAWGSPEALDRRADVYSLGATFYRILSKRAPFEGSTYEVLLKLHQEDPPKLRKLERHIPRDLETIVMKCLENDPQRRYESARAVSEELGRYLNGDPILAHPPAVFDRIARKTKKHKVLVGGAVIASVLIFLFLGLWIQSRLQSGKQALLAQQLGQEIQRMEGNLRTIYMLPLHDVRAEKTRVRQRMEQMISRIGKQAGKIGNAPVHYATGRIYFALQDYEKAQLYLEKAWNDGYKTPDVAYALGLVLGSLYQIEFQQIERLEIPAGKAAARLRIDKKYREPALKYLKESYGFEAESIDYVKALLSFYEKKYNDALVHASNAFQKTPWFYESKILEGDVFLAMGYEEIIRGKYDAAAEYFGKAEKCYLDSSKIAESDVRTYEGSCSIGNNLFYIDFITKSKEVPILFEKAVEACSKALKADPDRSEVHLQLSKMYWLYASFQGAAGQNTEDSIQKSLEAGERAVALDPKNVLSLTTLGLAFWEQGKQQIVYGKDPTGSFQRSIESSKRAVAIDPGSMAANNALGLAYMELGNYQIESGKDPRESLNLAVRCFRKTLEQNADFINGVVNLGVTHYLIGRYEMDHGQNPTASFEEATSALEKGTKLSPSLPFNYFHLLLINSDMARYRNWLGEEIEKDFKQAEHYFEKGMNLNPSYDQLLYAMSNVHLNRALFKFDRNISPAEDIERAIDFARRALEINPSSPWDYQNIAQGSIIEAKWKILKKQTPSRSLEQARQSVVKWVQISGKSASTYLCEAEADYLQARWNFENHREMFTLIQKGLSTIETAIKMNADLTELYAVRARLNLLRASSTKNSRERIDIAKNAQEDLRKALSVNSNLKKQYSEDLAEVERILSSTLSKR